MATTTRVAHCRYILWISYDGSRFPEMAKNIGSRGVMAFVDTALHSLFPNANEQLKLTQGSRTDKGVHARRNALCIQVPAEGIGYDKKEILSSLNKIAVGCMPGAISFLDIENVSDGFSVQAHALYRKYKYRILVARGETLRDTAGLCTLTEFAEANYSWLLPAGFHPYRAQEACRLFKGTHNLASFMKHARKEKLRDEHPPSTYRRIYHIDIDCGHSKYGENDGFRCYEISIIAKSFLRGQVRRMVSTILSYAYGFATLQNIKSLFLDPSPQKYHWHGFRPAPAGGLYLEDVVYDSRAFMNPVPYIHGLWPIADEFQAAIHPGIPKDEPFSGHCKDFDRRL